MTVYKAIQKEADAASELAVAHPQGQDAARRTDKINNGTQDVPSIL